MRATLAWVCLGQCFLAEAQSFSHRYDTFEQDYAQVGWGIEYWGDSGYVVFPFSYYSESPLLYIVVAYERIDLNGTRLLDNTLTGGLKSVYPGWANSSIQCVDGSYAIGGSTYAPGDISRAAITRYGHGGDSLSLWEYGDTIDDWIGRQILQTADGGYLLTGDVSTAIQVNAFLIKTDSFGSEEWSQTYGGSWNDVATSVDLASGSGYYFGGTYGTSNSNYDLWVKRVDSIGAPVWNKVWGGPYNEPHAHVYTLASGDVFVASSQRLNGNSYSTPYLACLSQIDGSTIWEHFYGQEYFSTLFFVGKEITPGGDLIAAGQTDEPGYVNGLLLRTNSNGDSLWMRRYMYEDSLMSNGQGAFRDVLPTADGGFIMCGYAHSSVISPNPPGYTQDVWVVKVDSMGCLVPGCNGISTITSQITNYRDALTIAPNPAHTNVHMGWALPTALRNKGNAEISIVNAQGRLVRTLPCDLSREGLDLDVSDLAAGIYHPHVAHGGPWLTGGKLVVE